MWDNLPLFPAEASKLAPQVDGIFFFLVIVTIFFSALIAFLIVFFAIKYRKEKHPHAEQIEGNIPLELTWTLIPLGISMVMFVWGAGIYFIESRPPKDAMEIYAVGKQWMWKFQHVEGVREINQLHVPVDRDVKVIMSSQDVIHDFFVPAFRTLHRDLVPSDESGHVSLVLRAILRHATLRDDRTGDRDGSRRVPGVAERGWRGRIAFRYRAEALPAVRMRDLPSFRYARSRTESGRCIWKAGAAG